MNKILSFAVVASAALSAPAFADSYRCQANLTSRGQLFVSVIGEGFSNRQACSNALSQCQDDLFSYQQQGYRSLQCRLNNDGPVNPGPVNPGPFPPGPGPFPPNPSPFPPAPGSRYLEVSCSSFNGQTNYCYVGQGAYSVNLLRQFSGASCQEGYSYGLTGNYLYVSAGCRGQFGVYIDY